MHSNSPVVRMREDLIRLGRVSVAIQSRRVLKGRGVKWHEWRKIFISMKCIDENIFQSKELWHDRSAMELLSRTNTTVYFSIYLMNYPTGVCQGIFV